jgi:5-deoxy-5-amino-3-dehydroquinate synthase
VSAAALTRVPVLLRDRPYDVIVGPGARHRLARTLRRLGAHRAFVVSARPRDWLPDPGVSHLVKPWADGESGKRLVRAEELCRAFAEYGLTARDALVGVGGGSTTDTVGLAGALYHRGLPVVLLPTSLRAQTDASVGAKAAAELTADEDLAGVYAQPRAVLCDTEFLETLPEPELTSGFGEIARAQFIGAGDLRDLPLPGQIAACLALKARIAAQDERDGVRRSILDYGDTLGQALERATAAGLRPGHALAIGTAYAARLAYALDRISAARVEEHDDVLRHYGLPTVPPTLNADPATVLEFIRRDRKTPRGLTFLLDGPHGVEPVSGIPESLVLSTYRAMTEAEFGKP